MSFGREIAKARKRNGISQKELAKLIRKENGETISPQYLSDIEHGRREPTSDHLINQFASALGLTDEYLHYLAGELPRDLRDPDKDPEVVKAAFRAFRRTINKE